MHVAWLTLCLLLLLVALAMAGVTIYLSAVALLRPRRMSDGKALYLLKRLTPEDLGLRWEPQQFDVRDAATNRPMRMAAWWLPATAPSDATVVLLHGYGDAKVGAIAWAPAFIRTGVNVLALDLRAHGESGGRDVTAGYHDRHDLRQVLDALRATRPAATTRLYLFGVSLGAGIACATADNGDSGRDDGGDAGGAGEKAARGRGGDGRRDGRGHGHGGERGGGGGGGGGGDLGAGGLSGIILECCYADYPTAARAHARRMGAPLAFLQPLWIRLAQWISGARFDEIRPVDLVRTIRCPILAIHTDADPFVPPDQLVAFAQALAGRDARLPPATHVIIPGAVHTKTLQTDPARWEQAVARFLIP